MAPLFVGGVRGWGVALLFGVYVSGYWGIRLMFRVTGLGFGVWGLGFGVWGLGFGVYVSGYWGLFIVRV